MKRYAIPIIIMVALIATVAQSASAHGKQMTRIKPDYDCFKYFNPDTDRVHTNEGDVVVTFTEGWEEPYGKFRCHCEQTGVKKWVCYWKLMKTGKTVEEVEVPDGTASHYGAKFVERKVSWQAWHGDDGCVRHVGYRMVIWAEHR